MTARCSLEARNQTLTWGNGGSLSMPPRSRGPRLGCSSHRPVDVQFFKSHETLQDVRQFRRVDCQGAGSHTTITSISSASDCQSIHPHAIVTSISSASDYEILREHPCPHQNSILSSACDCQSMALSPTICQTGCNSQEVIRLWSHLLSARRWRDAFWSVRFCGARR